MEGIVTRLTRIAGVRAAAFCSYDGINIVSHAVTGMLDEDELAAMSAEIGRTASQLLATTEDEHLKVGIFEAGSGKLVIGEAGRGYLVEVAHREANTGLLRLEVEQGAEELGRSFAGPADPSASDSGAEPS
jgi:predicted regulator of Ras-like GTPase activity (Roadblock/LC7/MglB family)